MSTSKSRPPPNCARRAGAALLSACLPWLGSCSGVSEGPREADAADPGSFVDRASLDTFCVSAGVAYPVVAEERTIDAANPAPTDGTNVGLHRAMLASTLGIYPRRFFAEIGLRKIVLCRDLAVERTACHAFADVERGTLYLDIVAGLPDASLARSLHHEIYHFIDFAEDGRLDDDPSWSRLNPPDFAYGAGGGSMQGDPEAGRPDESLVGFLNRYSTSGLAEDKAEVYASMMTDGVELTKRAGSDPILGRKLTRIRSALDRFGALAPTPPAGIR